jgi:hypothetical protein
MPRGSLALAAARSRFRPLSSLGEAWPNVLSELEKFFVARQQKEHAWSDLAHQRKMNPALASAFPVPK